MNNVTKLPDREPPDLKGTVRDGFTVWLEGRLVPNMHMYEKDDEILFVLDSRLMFGFPKDVALTALAFAANAMAIGAGFTAFNQDQKPTWFASKCVQLGGDPPASLQ